MYKWVENLNMKNILNKFLLQKILKKNEVNEQENLNYDSFF